MESSAGSGCANQGPKHVIEVNLGSEADAELLAKLRSVVASSGGSFAEVSYGVGGSQEVITYAVALPEGSLEVISETYVGLLLRGPAVLVGKVANAVRAL